MLGLEMAHVCLEVTANYTVKAWQLSGVRPRQKRVAEERRVGRPVASEGQRGWVLGNLGLL